MTGVIVHNLGWQTNRQGAEPGVLNCRLNESLQSHGEVRADSNAGHRGAGNVFAEQTSQESFWLFRALNTLDRSVRLGSVRMTQIALMECNALNRPVNSALINTS